MSELAKALAKAQDEFPVIERSKIVTVTTKTGGKYSFAYAPLDAILHLVRPVLTKNGLAFSQLLSQTSDGKPALRTSLLHVDGETLEDTCPLPTNGANLSPQEFGSLITYVRRYACVAILGIASEEDDDGNAAQGNSVQGTRPDSNPAVDAQKAWETARQAADDDGLPASVRIHFGKNGPAEHPPHGVRLGDLSPAQLKWYAETWEPKGPNDSPASPVDLRLKQAAIALAAGDNSTDFDIPFA